MHKHNYTHTPGPWAYDTNGLITAGPRRLHIAQTAVTGMGRAAELNAALLAAAPDMLQALKIALISMERAVIQMGIDPAMDTECQIIRAAITKAQEPTT
jgi:hypothetical protein